MKAFLLLLAVTLHSVTGALAQQSQQAQQAQQAQHVRSDHGRYSITCQSVPLEALLREIATVTPIELWLDEGLADKRISVDVDSVTLKEAFEAVFEGVKVNFVLYSDPSNPERVTKVYAGIGGTGRLGRVPTVTATEDEPVPSRTVKDENPSSADLPPELDPETLLQNPDAQGALESLRELLDRNASELGDSSDEVGDEDANDASIPPVPAALQELFQQLPPLPQDASDSADEPPPDDTKASPAGPAKKDPKKQKNPRQL